VRLWIPYLSIPVGFGLLMLQLVADLVAVILGVDKPFGLEDA
jgi:TRAP-type C4-dicarboxylate transport system permease small subunit